MSRPFITEKWTEFACDICGSKSARVLGDRTHKVAGKTSDFDMKFHDVSCNDCGFVYEGKRPSEAFLMEFYSDAHDIFSSDVKIEVDYNINNRLQILKDHLPKGARIAEIGAGAGHFCKDMKDHGYDAVGIDPKRQDEREGLINAFVDEKSSGEGLDGNYDAVVSYYVMEHVQNPREWLTQISRLLKPGGLMVIEVPNFATHPYESLNFEHMAHFSPEPLEELLRQHGFKIISAAGYPPSRYFGFFAIGTLEKPELLDSPLPCALKDPSRADKSQAIYNSARLEMERLEKIAQKTAQNIRAAKAANPALKICFWAVNDYSVRTARALPEFLDELYLFDNARAKIGQVFEPFRHAAIKPDAGWNPSEPKLLVLCSPAANHLIREQISTQNFKNCQILDGTTLSSSSIAA